jgi:hypothetical protein
MTMRSLISIALTCVLLCTVGQSALLGQWRTRSLDPEIVSNSLRWFSEWMYRIPLGSGQITCRGERSGAYEFLYCEPAQVEIDISRETTDGRISMINAFRAESFDQVASNAPNRFGAWSTVEPIRLAVTPEQISKSRTKDLIASKAFHERTRAFVENTKDARWAGSTAYYPWVFRGDPTFHVYIARNGRVETVWEFNIVRGSVSPSANFNFDEAHGNLPSIAQDNLADPNKWFRTSQIGGSAITSPRPN